MSARTASKPRPGRIHRPSPEPARWVSVVPAPSTYSHAMVSATCSCGVTKTIRRTHYEQGASKSCGCISREVTARRSRSHGCAPRGGARMYGVWKSMVKRCTDTEDDNYRLYGGRGITVCERWRSDVRAFVSDMGPRPPGLTLDRKENSGGYWCGRCDECVSLARPANCRWATSREQVLNRRVTFWVTFAGETLCASEWGSRIGTSGATVACRIKRGWTPERAVTTPPQAPGWRTK